MTDTPEKSKRDERAVEWSFDFANIANSFNHVMESLAGDEEVQTATYTVEKDTATEARMKLGFSVGRGFLQALPAGGNLFEANLKYIGDVEFSAEGDTTKTVTLRPKTRMKEFVAPIKQGLRAIVNREELDWNLHLSPDVPLSLDISAGVGPVTMNLASLHIRSLTVNSGVGELHLTLPQQSERLDVRVTGGVGHAHIHVPEDADMSLHVAAGVGAVDMTIPANIAIQVVTRSGLGSINVPDNLRRVTAVRDKVDPSQSIWQSEGFDLATRRVTINYTGGVGAFNLKTAE